MVGRAPRELTQLADVLLALRALESSAQTVEHQPWGTVTGDARFPHVHDANHALVFGGVTPDAVTVRGAVRSMAARSGARFEQIEVVDPEAHARLVADLAREYGEQQRFALMVAGPRDPRDAAGHGFTVREVRPVDRTFWLAAKRAYFDSVDIPDVAVHEIVARALTVHFPAGRRAFAAYSEDVLVSVATMHSLDGVTLVDDVATVPALRGRGGASAVLARVLECARAMGSTCFLFTGAANAQRLYERLGFRTVAEAAQFHRDLS